MVQSKNLKTIILLGPTAVGKSDLAIQFALEQKAQRKTPIEIINADSVCFYQHFDIGSAKPSREDLKLVPHHLINVAAPESVYDASKFLADVNEKLASIHRKGHRAIVVGGSGFYLKALRLGLWDAPSTSVQFRNSQIDISTEDLFKRLQELDPIHSKKISACDRYRIIRALEIIELSDGKKPSELEASMNTTPDERFELWVVDRDRNELEQRILHRIKKMIELGFVDEVKLLRERFPNAKTLHAVGYQQVMDFIDQVAPKGRKIRSGLDGLMDEIALSHRQLAKQQRTWFKSLNPNRQYLLPQDDASIKAELMIAYQ